MVAIERWNTDRFLPIVIDWLILTKRPELIADLLPSDWGSGYANVWMGTVRKCQSGRQDANRTPM